MPSTGGVWDPGDTLAVKAGVDEVGRPSLSESYGHFAPYTGRGRVRTAGTTEPVGGPGARPPTSPVPTPGVGMPVPGTRTVLGAVPPAVPSEGCSVLQVQPSGRGKTLGVVCWILCRWGG